LREEVNDRVVPKSTFRKWQALTGILTLLTIISIIAVGVLSSQVLSNNSSPPSPPSPPGPSPNTRPLVDPDTPSSALNTTDLQGQHFDLVFSDEFATDGRSFGGNDDPYWEAVDHYNPSTNDLEYYSPSQVTTSQGSLVITATNTSVNGGVQNFTSGMLMSWNRFCFTGGIFEARVQLPGSSSVPGFWPAVWLLGNLGRAGWIPSTNNMWPYSYGPSS